MGNTTKVNNAIIFDGNCAEAITYYEKIFNIKAKKILHYKDVPEIIHDDVYPRMKDFSTSNLIRMAVIEIGGVDFRFMDLVDGINMRQTERLAFMIIDTITNAQVYYKNMVKAGCAEVQIMPRKRFFSEFNAIVIDKFGIKWTFDGGYKF